MLLNPWTEEQLETLRGMTRAGNSIVDISEALQRRYQAVRAKQEKLGLAARKDRVEQHDWSEQDRDELRRMYEKGMSSAAIARALPFKVSTRAVQSQRTFLGLVYERPDHVLLTSEDKKSLHSLFELGWSDGDFAARLNRSIPQIIYYRRKFGLKRGTRH